MKSLPRAEHMMRAPSNLNTALKQRSLVNPSIYIYVYIYERFIVAFKLFLDEQSPIRNHVFIKPEHRGRKNNECLQQERISFAFGFITFNSTKLIYFPPP